MSPYRSYHGTAAYSPPEYYSRGEYCGWPATVWSLGILMFAMLCGHFPSDFDLHLLQYKRWSKPGLSKVPLPKEITLTFLANKGHRVPEIIRLLDWTDHPDHFVTVLECPSPCENLVEFMRRHGGSLDEHTVRQIMWQATNAAHMCCLRRVLHRDVKLENLLINRETSEVKLIDFGCGDILRMSPYRSYHVGFW
ncbi:serine threonine- kinase pim-2-like protein [Labeo rohita]|uniref:non-specific serine/threonine protein kinase n=1 Tax=Labeo rohita TaxID=84645 RepID=A0A498P0Q2_LABRO|nr:serine threonine- kinase pim-2-like protein [Labeo rohita]